MNAGTDKDNRYILRNHSSFRKTGLQGKIILHRIISVVCLTSFLSETWNRNPAMMMNYLTGPEREDDRWQACLSLMIAWYAHEHSVGPVITWVVFAEGDTHPTRKEVAYFWAIEGGAKMCTMSRLCPTMSGHIRCINVYIVQDLGSA